MAHCRLKGFYILGEPIVKFNIVCSWCGRSIGMKECICSAPQELPKNPVTHSICPECHKKELAQIKATLTIPTKE